MNARDLKLEKPVAYPDPRDAIKPGIIYCPKLGAKSRVLSSYRLLQ